MNIIKSTDSGHPFNVCRVYADPKIRLIFESVILVEVLDLIWLPGLDSNQRPFD